MDRWVFMLGRVKYPSWPFPPLGWLPSLLWSVLAPNSVTTNLLIFWVLKSLYYSLASLVAQMVNHLSAMQKTQVRSLGRKDPLEKEMAVHSSAFAWKIPWTEEPGRLQSMGSQRVGHDWVTSWCVSKTVSSLTGEQVLGTGAPRGLVNRQVFISTPRMDNFYEKGPWSWLYFSFLWRTSSCSNASDNRRGNSVCSVPSTYNYNEFEVHACFVITICVCVVPPPPPPMVKRASLKMLKDFNWKFHKNAMLNTLPTFLHFIFLTQ